MTFRDKPYNEKRAILRQYYIDNKEAHKAVKILAFEVKKKLSRPIIEKLLDYETIISFLIDGHIAFEIINECVFKLDPVHIQYTFINNELVWVQFPGTVNEKIIDKDTIIYISYDTHEVVSFLGTIYEGTIDPTDFNFIKDHADFIVGKLTNKKLRITEILNVDNLIKRVYKIKSFTIK
jgi:hypothetical protein